MPSTGYIQVRAFASDARIPLKDVAITVTATDGTAIATRLTDRSGKIEPIPIPVPAPEESRSPDPGELPFTQVDLYARTTGYHQIENEGLQVFPNITTTQDLEMVPLSELPQRWGTGEVFITPKQNL